MMEIPQSQDPEIQETLARDDRRMRRRIYLITFVSLVILAIAGFFAITRYSAADRERTRNEWNTRLSMTADRQQQAVVNWLDDQYAVLGKLANNTSLKLYMTELMLSGGNPSGVTDEPAQAAYLRRLLMATAAREGFTSAKAGGPGSAAVSIAFTPSAGLALMDSDQNILVATPELPDPEQEPLRTFMQEVPRGERALLGPYLDAQGKAVMAFVVPVYKLQESDAPRHQIGSILGIREVGDSLFPLLEVKDDPTATGESLLVRPDGVQIVYISPLQEGIPALSRRIDRIGAEMAAVLAVEKPGSFARKQDYTDTSVFFTSRAVPGTDWSLIRKVDETEAMADSISRTRWLLLVFALLTALFAATVIAIGRHASARRKGDAARAYRRLAEDYKRQEELLSLVTDSETSAIFIIDEDGIFRFANRAAAKRSHIDRRDMIGKPIGAVLGPEASARYTELNTIALVELKPRTQVHRYEKGERDDQVHVVQSRHIPLTHIPIGDEAKQGVLIVEQDITKVMLERERRERMLERLIDTLVTMVDRRDPHAAHHSANVARLSRAIAEAMQLDPVSTQTAEIAGKLMNIGKITVPPELLTQKASLSDADMRNIRDSISASADMLEGIDFNGPVVDTLRQCQERADGSGLNKRKSNDTLITARIVAVANAFVGMTSPRAYREAMDAESAIEHMRKDAGTIYDPEVVDALVRYLETHGSGKSLPGIIHLMEPEKQAS